MPRMRLDHSTVVVLLNEQGKVSAFIISTYCPPDLNRNSMAIEELRNIILSINECYQYPQIIVFSDTN